MAIRKYTRTPANANTTREKAPKITNYKTSALLLRPVRSYYVLTARPPRPLYAYCVSIEIYWLSSGVYRRFRGALTSLIGFLLRVFYVYHDCTVTLWRFYHVFSATIKTGQIFGNFKERRCKRNKRSDRRTSAFVLNILKTNAVALRSSTTMAITTYDVWRFYRAFTTLMASLALSVTIFGRRRSAVGTPLRCDGTMTNEPILLYVSHFYGPETASTV